tara:strand:+ start:246 stop:827 length:582 start_codon:yes stop_codon:yes gene_type:complete
MFEKINLLGTLIVALGPIFLVFYFLFDSILQANLKGIIYILGVIGTCLLTIFTGNTISLKNNYEPDRAICFPITIKNMINISNLPLSQSIYGFTFFFIAAPLYTYKYFNYNIFTLVIFAMFIMLDFFLLMQYKCFDWRQILLSLIVGSFIGLLYSIVLLKNLKKEYIYIAGAVQDEMCELPKKSKFKCTLKKR